MADQKGSPFTDTSQFPDGHVGHLTAFQQAQLDAFKSLCQNSGIYHLTNSTQLASHDDATLLRFLRARRFDVDQAYTQFKATEEWRRENELEKLYETINVQEYEKTRSVYPQWTGRRDRRGIPVYLFEIAHLDSKTMATYSSETSSKKGSSTANSKAPAKMMRLFALYEHLTQFIMPLCTAVQDRPHPETPISQSNNIVDISNVGLWQFWNLKAHMQDASQLATAHYPETLDRIFIIGAPSFFPTVWGWVKRWFDPITVSKIFILSREEVKSTLEEYIALENIPRKYGGTLDFVWGDAPNLDPAITDSLTWIDKRHRPHGSLTIPSGPIKWIDEDGVRTMVAVGYEDASSRNTRVATLNSSKSPPLPGATSSPV